MSKPKLINRITVRHHKTQQNTDTIRYHFTAAGMYVLVHTAIWITLSNGLISNPIKPYPSRQAQYSNIREFMLARE